jgi:hypothetical protein
MPACSACHNGNACRMCLMLVAPEHCPGLAEVLRGCHHAQLGEICEGDGGCGTSDVADNCLISPQHEHGEFLGDAYVRVGCEPDDLPELTWLLFIMFTAMLFGGFCRNWLNKRRYLSSLASADGATPGIEMDGVPCGVPIMVPVAEVAEVSSPPPPPPPPAATFRSAPDASAAAPGASEGAEYRGPAAVAVPYEGESAHSRDPVIATAMPISAAMDPFPARVAPVAANV